ncbi:MAG: hypothetical protein ACYDCF_07545, partial [Burkholderiales bacterium]
MRLFLFAFGVLLLAGCAGLRPASPPPAMPEASEVPPVVCPTGIPLVESTPVATTAAIPARPRGKLVAAKFSGIPQWNRSVETASWTAFLKSCTVLGKEPAWNTVCNEAARMP